MILWSRIRSWSRTTFRRSPMENEMDAELRFHIETFAEDLVRGGVSREEAVRRARIEFGGQERFKEECREAVGAHFLETLCLSRHHRSTRVGACKAKRLKQLHRQILWGRSHRNHRQQTVRSHANHRNIRGSLVHDDEQIFFGIKAHLRQETGPR